ncbi:endo-beta-N-acetylglucosaminidase [Muribaculum intestinale]|uniref:endo-beta-N-acetylglucosaminidase n=1 Tax=Muribaculum intestinale TaxID=1796646 RepID=UPI0025A9C98C|nr:GEVED domain-containing protein [Muribaculum intestinale]
MKRSFLKSSMLLTPLVFASPLMAQESSESIFDQSPWENEQVLELFSKAWDQGRNYPTKAEFESIGLTFDLEFVRSHSRQRATYKDASKDVVSDINHDRRLWCNLPAGYGKGLGGYPSTQFDQDVFSMWNYTTIFGSWNYGFLQAPGAWVDAAHKNGTRIYGGIKFFESWNDDGSESAFRNFIATKNEDGTYKYARAFVNAAAFFGCDGYNYNQEGTAWRDSEWVNFHAEVSKIARELGIEGFGIGQYTQRAQASASEVGTLYGSAEKGKVFDCMLNYSGNKLGYRGVPTTIASVKGEGLSLDDIYQGQLLVGISSDYWNEMNTETTKQMNICIWGEHDQSRFFQFRVGSSPTNVQENYQLLLEKAFSGANRNPLSRPEISNAWGSFQVADADHANEQLNNSPGFASMFAERTAIGGNLPFETHFNLGNGENYFYNGKVTNGSWYNMSMQDIVPTYRWLVTAKGDMKTFANDIDVRFTHEDAYVGGSCIRLSGATTAGNDIVLYRTALKASAGNVKVNLALKGAKGASNLSVILKKEGSDNWIEVPAGELAGTAWEAKTLNVSGIAKGEVIEYIGLRVNSSAEGYKMLVGKLNISDDLTVSPAALKANSLLVEVKEETTKSLSVKLNWEPAYEGYTTSIDKFGMVYNDEINVDHFEILYKEGNDGRVKEVGRTAQWATYIGNLPVAQTTNAFIGVRAVSVDLKSYSDVQWVAIPHSSGELPEPIEEDPYGRSWMSSNGNGTLENCIKHIWVEKVTTEGATQNLNYTATSNPLEGVSTDQYYFAADHKLILNQGQKITMTFKGNNSGTGESLQYDFVYPYLDYDGNYSFLDADEVLGQFGKMNAGTIEIVNPGLTIEFTVPEDAHIGESRLRIVGSDAWTPHPGPTGGTVKGYSIDFPVEIQGTNADRGPAETYKDLQDKGEADEPAGLGGGSGSAIENIGDDATLSTVKVIGGVAYFTNVDKAWFYDMNGRCVEFVNNVASVDLSGLASGVYVVKMQNGQVARSAKIVK